MLNNPMHTGAGWFDEDVFKAAAEGRWVEIFESESDSFDAFYRLFDGARSLGHESAVDRLYVMIETDGSAEEIKSTLIDLINTEAFKHAHRAADAA